MHKKKVGKRNKRNRHNSNNMSSNKDNNMISNKDNNCLMPIISFCLSVLCVFLYFFFNLNNYEMNVKVDDFHDFKINTLRYALLISTIFVSSYYSNWKSSNRYLKFANIFNFIICGLVVVFIYNFNSSLSNDYLPFLTNFFIIVSVFLGLHITSLLKSFFPSEFKIKGKIVISVVIVIIVVLINIYLIEYNGNDFNLLSLISGALLSSLFPFLFSYKK
ncbi:MAG: hypothetical protein LBE28_10990 [Providencia alcalifaciens]|nr:hypothetical protein [Providencia alcalifaciens]